AVESLGPVDGAVALLEYVFTVAADLVAGHVRPLLVADIRAAWCRLEPRANPATKKSRTVMKPKSASILVTNSAHHRRIRPVDVESGRRAATSDLVRRAAGSPARR
ncbi:hypothetical protein, partial [Nocardia puris]|uniref:hypothetical protein n=1 Tax=Nocardia puris TaxID=208602 RepID=UPI001E42F16C